VYSREIDGKTLTLSASGWTYDRLFVLYDYETESIWAYQVWAKWKAAYPETKYLKFGSRDDPW
jgi:hypothetical protein